MKITQKWNNPKRLKIFETVQTVDKEQERKSALWHVEQGILYRNVLHFNQKA